MRRRALALFVLPLALAACGSGGMSNTEAPKLTPLGSVKSAATKTAKAKSQHITLKGSSTAAGTLIEVSGSGDFDNTKKLGSVHAEFSAAGLSGTIDEVMNGTTIYIKSPLFSAALPKGKTWMKLDLQKFGTSKGIDFSALLSQDPATSLAQLQASGDVTEVGDETIDGAETTHYRAHIDPAKLPQAAQRQALAHARYGPLDIWVGKDDGYVRRVHTTYSTKTGASARQAVTLTMDFSDFDKEVSVSIPPESETLDATDKAIMGLGG